MHTQTMCSQKTCFITINWINGKENSVEKENSVGKERGSWEKSEEATLVPKQILLFLLVLAGVEIIFLLVAGTVLCFGFSMRITLITD